MFCNFHNRLLQPTLSSYTRHHSLNSLCEALRKLPRSQLTLKNAYMNLSRYVGSDWQSLVGEVDLPLDRRFVLNIFDIRGIAFDIIYWPKGTFTNIHNHPERGVAIRVLDGVLEEEHYSPMGEYGMVSRSYPRSVQRVADDTWTVHNAHSTHRIRSNLIPSFSLHIYLPSRQQCQQCHVQTVYA